MATRPAGKAGTWYPDSPTGLETEFKEYLGKVPSSFDGVLLPIRGARIVIAPHAGYDFSGACAAWAYKTLDLSQAKRVFVLGPTHTYGFRGCAATTFGKYATPFGDLTIDREIVQELKEAIGREKVETEDKFEAKDEDKDKSKVQIEDILPKSEKEEHSLEMHMPYLYFRCQETFDSSDQFPTIVPLLVGSTSGEEEEVVGRALLPYIMDPANAFIISSDFCHWGASAYGFAPYSPTASLSDLVELSRWDLKPKGLPIRETIRVLDEAVMDAIETGSHAAYLHSLRRTQNSVCGRHPIGIMMAALELLGKQPGYEDKGRFNIIQYQHSKEKGKKEAKLESPKDYSVSYVSAYAVV